MRAYHDRMLATAETRVQHRPNELSAALLRQLMIYHARRDQLAQTVESCRQTVSAARALVTDAGRLRSRMPSGPLEIVPGLGEVTDPAVAWQTARVFSELVALAEVRASAEGRTPEELDLWMNRLRAWREHSRSDDFVFNSATRRISVGETSVRLTRRESQLLAVFMARPGAWMRHEELIVRAWRNELLSPEQLRLYVTRLRRRLAEVGAGWRLANSRGSGYRLERVIR